MVDSFGIYQANRLPYSIKIGLIVIAFLMILPVSSAETLKVISNTEPCIYQSDIDKDYCKTVYELCDPSLDIKKVDFQFKTEDDKSLKSSIDGLSYDYSSKITKTVCREITIEGYKNPYKNIDNVLCYDSKCHEEYIWWNTSFISKFAINASTNSGEVTIPLLLGDSNVTINGFEQIVWCNYTLNTTRQVVGYFYFTNETFYQCVDRTETFAVGMDVDEGNGTDGTNPSDGDTLFIAHLNDTTDSSVYSRAITNNGATRTPAGQIGGAHDFDGSSQYMSISDSPDFHGSPTLSYGGWFNTDTISVPTVLFAKEGDDFSWMLTITTGNKPRCYFKGVSGEDGIFSTSEMVTGKWEYIMCDYNGSHVSIYINGVLNASKAAVLGNIFNSATNIGIGARMVAIPNRFWDGKADELSIHNSSLSADEIRAMYENQAGTFGIAQSGPIVNISQNVSVKHFDVNTPSFFITSQQYQTIINDTFTLVSPIDMVIKGSAGAMKQDGSGATTFVSARLIFNGITLYDQIVRSIRGTGDRGAFTLPIINATGQGGTNRFILQMKRTGNDDINISNLGFHVDTTLLNNDVGIIIGLNSSVVNYTSTAFLNIANFTIDKPENSTVLIDVDHRFESTSNNIAADCFLESEQTGERTDTYSRWLQFSGGVGSSGINYRSQIPANGTETWMMFCKSSTNNIILNNITSYIMNQLNVLGDSCFTIGGFQNSTSKSGLTGSGNIILSTDYRNAQGPQLEVLVTIIMQSTSGSQDGLDSPVFIIRTNDSVCNTSIERSLTSNSDIGTAKIYLDCNVTSGVLKNYKVVVDVSSGNTLNILNASISSYEVTPQLVIEGIVPPIVRITSPANNSNVTEIIDIESVVVDLSRTGWQSVITVMNSTGDIVLVVLNESAFENTTIVTFNTRSVENGNYTIEWTVSNDVGNNSDDIIVFIFNIEIVAPPTIEFCVNDDFLLSRDSSRTTTNGNISIVVIDRLTFCKYGCSNWTLLTFGNPGCEEGPYVLSIIFIIFLILIILIIRGAVK